MLKIDGELLYWFAHYYVGTSYDVRVALVPRIGAGEYGRRGYHWPLERPRRIERDPRGRATPAPKTRSKITNGNDLSPGIDGRSATARRFKDITSAIIADLGGTCSESRLQLIRRFAAASCLAELLEAKMANGQEINIAEHASLSSTLVWLASRIGIERIQHSWRHEHESHEKDQKGNTQRSTYVARARRRHRSNKQKRAAEFAEHRDNRGKDEDDLENDSE